jgi:hypothetical protein
MTDQHPINPPTELVRQWIRECDNPEKPRWQEYEQDIATRAAQWGWNKRGTINEAQLQERADQELAACREWTESYAECGHSLYRHRRPKPPSLKEQALKELRQLPIDPELGVCASALDTIRQALEALDG